MVYSYRKVKRSPALADSDKIKNLTAQNFQQEIKSGTVLVDFWASWCMPCKMMAPVLNELAEELPENTSVAKLNVEHFQAVSAKYQVKGIPTMILFRNGKEVSRFVGVKSKDFLKKQMMKVA
ncbi:MAG: thioredoxin [Bacteroidetes bacterium]|nr:thioredoxin [Bacteroidota bacterium]MBU1719718.1 thioredoxin [Bacteroidota bacterium]